MSQQMFKVASMGRNACMHMSHHGLPHSFECSGLCLYSITDYVDTLLKGLDHQEQAHHTQCFQMPPQVKIQGFKSGDRSSATGPPGPIQRLRNVVEVLVNINAEVGWRSSVLQPHCLS